MSSYVHSLFLMASFAGLVSVSFPSCGGGKSDTAPDTLAQVAVIDLFPELGLAGSTDSLNGTLSIQSMPSTGQTYTYGYNAQKELVRAKMTLEASAESYEFIFQPDGAAGLCRVTSANLNGWAPLREERPTAFLSSLQGPNLNLSATSIDSLAEILLSYRMDLMVNEP